jgi:hypothetical protein
MVLISQRVRIITGSCVGRWAVRVRLPAVDRFLFPERLFPPPPVLPFRLELAERDPPRPDPLRDALVVRLEVPLPDVPRPDVPGLAPPVPGLGLLPVLRDPLPAVLRDPLDEGRRRFPLAETVVGSITSGGSSW